MNRKRRGSVLWIAMMMLTIDAIRRFFGEFRPADLVASGLEVLFIVTILWLELPEVFHKRRVRKRIKMIYGMMFDAQRLEDSAPTSACTDEAVASAWVSSVQVWIEETESKLAKYSVSAEISFKTHQWAGAGIVFTRVTRLANAQDCFKELRSRTLALQNIMEKADVYF